MLSIYDEVINLKGVGEKLSKVLKERGILKIEDLFHYLPIRYEKREKIRGVSEVSYGQECWIKGRVIKTRLKFSRYKRMPIVEVYFSDGRKSAKAIFFNQKYLIRAIRKNDWIIVFGEVSAKDENGIEFKIVPKKFEKLQDEPEEGINPIYERIYNVSSRMMWNLIREAFFSTKIEENLPEEIIKKYGFYGREENLRRIHLPEGSAPRLLPHGKVLRRLAYEELFYFQIALEHFRRKKESILKDRKVEFNERDIDKVEEILNIKLTKDQKKAIVEIMSDISSEKPMRRLLQGEVGSGKTIVALIVSYFVSKAQYQSAFMVPTEILANQHYKRVIRTGLFDDGEVGLLTGSTKKKDRKKILKALEDGTIKLLIGTHALFQEGVRYRNLSLVIIDEQHRFGVSQKTYLELKGKTTDLLVMTATPIPRTLHLTLYSDLSISTLRELPFGEKKIFTYIVPQKKREEMYSWIEKAVLEKGKQGFIVYPLIEESEKLKLKDLNTYYELLKERFKSFSLGILHGKMKPKEKEEVREKFEKGEIKVLLTTSIIEVGIDISSAYFIVIEHPERYGLSQLHQMRGRVSRAGEEGYCFLMEPERAGALSKKRLRVIKGTLSGFEIAEADLKLRGQGNPVGKEQWGKRIFKFADPFSDIELLKETKEIAKNYDKYYDKIPALKGYIKYLEKKVKEVGFN